SELTQHTNVSERLIQCALANWCNTGDVAIISSQHGRLKALSSLNMDYIKGLLEQTPDLYLEEIQRSLEDSCQVLVALSTIAALLCHWGWERKKVHIVVSDMH
ncbi:hypothetical protein BT96DRAFT_826550, partial [Gymnopus androsaceus JB14]